MGSGDTPDVVYMWNYPAYADGLEPLDEYIDKEAKSIKTIFTVHCGTITHSMAPLMVFR